MTESSAMSSMLTDLTTVATSTLTLVGNVVSEIVATPFLLMTTGILLLGAACGILGRMLSRS